jgi:PAS domain S-box-containing protein
MIEGQTIDAMRETARLGRLLDYDVLDTAPEHSFDRLTRLAAELFDAPIALVSLIDAERQWFKSRHGLDATETPRDQAFCAHAIDLEARGALVVADATLDPRFLDNPLVTGDPKIRFYAGAVLTSPEGFNLGTLCVIDTKSRPAPSAKEVERLKILAGIVVDELELRRATRSADEKRRQLELAERMASLGHWRFHVASGRAEWSDEVYRIHGVTPADFNPNLEDSLTFYGPASRAEIAGAVTRAVETGEGYSFEAQLRRPDGTWRDVMCKADCEFDAAGKIVALVGVFQDVTEQVRGVRSLQRSQAKYKLLADHAGDVIARIRLDGASTYISPAIYELLGLRPSEMAGKSAQAFVYPEDQPLILEAFGRMAAGSEEETLQHRAAHKDGHAVWVETRLTLVRDEAGEPLEMVAVIRDNTERKRLEEEIVAAGDAAREQARRAGMAEQIAGLGYWRMDARTHKVVWSEQMYQIYGLDPAEPLRFSALVAMTHSEDAPASTGRLKRALEGGEAEEHAITRIFRGDGEMRYLISNSMAERSADGEVEAVLGTVMDITDQRRAEEALEDSERRYRLLAENARDLIMQSDMDGKVVYISPSVEAMTGYAPSEIIGKPALDLIHPEDAHKVREAVAVQINCRGALPPKAVEYRALHKDGREIWFEARPTLAFEGTDGRMCGITDVVRDITSRKALEAELRTARADAEAAAAVKSEFLANMSHELRTPLTSIIGFTGLVAAQTDLPPLSKKFIDKVSAASRALLCTVNDILDFSKLEAGQVTFTPEPTDPVVLGQTVLDLFLPQAGAKDLALDLVSTLPPDLVVDIDPDRLRQVLLNLVGNAVKFTAEGSVTLTLAYDELRQRLRADVADTGPGVAFEHQARLFQRFSQVDGSLTRSKGGTGLGLAICKGLVEAMGGAIGVVSEAGAGSRFWFEISAPRRADPAVDNADGASDMTFPGVRVLVADDHATNRELVRLFLTAIGAEVTEARDGREAVDLAAQWPYDVILMDLRMPGLDGYEACAEIRTGNGPNETTPILAFSADAESEGEEKLASQGFDGAVAKPIEAGLLIAAVARATDFVGQQEPVDAHDAR